MPVEPPHHLLGQGGDLHAMSRALIERANLHGGPDNVTCVLVRFSAAG